MTSMQRIRALSSAAQCLRYSEVTTFSRSGYREIFFRDFFHTVGSRGENLGVEILKCNAV